METAESDAAARAIQAELEEILESEVFTTAHRSRSFLRYVVERSLKGSPPKEYEIAVEALGRGVDYDPSVDATVRVEASRVRSRLLQYYATRGKHDPILIEIPKGSYRATFRNRELADDESTVEGGLPSPIEPDPQSGAITATVMAPGTSAEPAGAQKDLGSARQTLRSSFLSLPSRIQLVLALGGIAAVFAAAMLLLRFNSKARTPANRIRSLAVLPLQNLSGSPSENYFAEGITDELTTEMAHVSHLRVVSRTSAMQSVGGRKSLRQIAQQLGVDAVVEGSVVRSGGRVRVTAQLIDVRDDRHLWAQSFEEPLEDVLSLEDNIARQIASQTQAALVGGPLAKASPQVDPTAYDAYLRGLYFLHRREAHTSAKYFQQAVSGAPTYAGAYAGLAQALESESVVGETAEPEIEARATDAAVRAIELDPNNGDGYAALAWIKISNRGDLAAIKQDLDTSIRLNPSSSIAEMEYSLYLEAVGRAEEALVHMRRALQLDPLSFYMNRQLGSALYFARHYPEALVYLQRASEMMEPVLNSSVTNWTSRVYEVTGNVDAAERDDLLSLGSHVTEAELKPLRTAYARAGWKAYQLARIDLLSRHPAYGPCGPYEIGESYLRLGRLDEALSSLARGIDKHCFWAGTIRVDPLLDSLRSTPGYVDLLHHAHL